MASFLLALCPLSQPSPCQSLRIGGWSYGGYMSEWAITQTDMFKAAVSGAGLSNLISQYGTEQGLLR
jgi:dipeptidyl aminopeptidase/acylaminoacyl peptidase